MSPQTEIGDSADLGRMVREIRRKRGLKQADLAARCGVGIRFISNLENGKETVEFGRALRVIRFLGLRLKVERRDGRA